MKKTTAVIILNWNGLDLLRRFLPAAVSYTISPTADLFVADNGSSDASVTWVKENYPQVKVIELGKNYGFAEGYNRAIAMTSYELTLLLNSDVEVTRGWLAPLEKFMQVNKDVGALQPKILSWHEPDCFEYAGAAGGYLDKLGYPYCRGRLFDKLERDEGQYDGAPADICWASGAALMVRTADYERVGGLDTAFFAHMEEIDLCCRLHSAGKRVCIIPDSKVYHVGGASLPKENPKKTYLNFRNNLLLLHKNMPQKSGRRLLFWRRLVDTLALGMFLFKGEWKNVKAVWDAHRDFRKMKKGYTSFPERDVLSEQPGSRRCILIDYYILRKKK